MLLHEIYAKKNIFGFKSYKESAIIELFAISITTNQTFVINNLFSSNDNHFPHFVVVLQLSRRFFLNNKNRCEQIVKF